MRRVIIYQDIPASGEMQIPLDSVVTASARELAAERGGFQLRNGSNRYSSSSGSRSGMSASSRRSPADYHDIALQGDPVNYRDPRGLFAIQICTEDSNYCYETEDLVRTAFFIPGSQSVRNRKHQNLPARPKSALNPNVRS